MAQKIFPLDTSVIINEPPCIFSFEEHDVGISTAVLNEINNHKDSSNDSLRFPAREFARYLRDLSNQGDLLEGVPLGSGKGKLKVIPHEAFDDRLQNQYGGDTMDNRIINSAIWLKKSKQYEDVVLVTADITMLLIAKTLGVTADELQSAQSQIDNEEFTGIFHHDKFPVRILDKLFKEKVIELPERYETNFSFNRFAILRNGKKSALVMRKDQELILLQKELVSARGIRPRNAEQVFAMNGLLSAEEVISSGQLITLEGPAGTGKTLLATACGLAMTPKSGKRKLSYTRMHTPVGDKDMGYLPGTAKEKFDPYSAPFMENLSFLKTINGIGTPTNDDLIKTLMHDDRITTFPLSYVRGSTINNSFVILDEAQNTTRHEVKTLISRMGENSIMVASGDLNQIDRKYLTKNTCGLAYLIDKMRGSSFHQHIRLERVERSLLAKEAIARLQ